MGIARVTDRLAYNCWTKSSALASIDSIFAKVSISAPKLLHM
jgi:hypothetical protein